MHDDLNQKDNAALFSNPNNKHLNNLLSENKKLITQKDLLTIIEFEHGQHLAEIMYKEWAIAKLKQIIANWKNEHSNSLALLFENESQKILLEELNTKLTKAAAIMKKDMKMAENVQRSLLPQTPPKTNNFDIAFHYQPFASVAGDFYDFYVNEYNDLTGFVLSDVSGHGIASSLITALTKPIFFRIFRDNPNMPLGKIVEIINNRIIEQIEDAENYLTGVILRFYNDTIEYVNAAHPNIIKKDAGNNNCKPLKPDNKDVHGAILGISALRQPFEAFKFSINCGDVLIIYSDCLNESINADGREFGEENIQKVLMETSGGKTAEEILKEFIVKFNEYTEDIPLKDDLTVTVLKKK